jgi:hypothetical protein
MNAEQQQLFDEAILRVLDRNESTFGMGATALQVLVGEFGFSPRDPAEVTRRLEYMADAEIAFVAPVSKGQFNPANRTWRITARGTNHLRSRGF